MIHGVELDFKRWKEVEDLFWPKRLCVQSYFGGRAHSIVALKATPMQHWPNTYHRFTDKIIGSSLCISVFPSIASKGQDSLPYR